MKQNIIESNKLIAEFMGWTWSKEGNGKTYLLNPRLNPEDFIFSTRPELLAFHRSWDWLMPVVEKIEDTHADKNHHYGHNFKINNWEIVVQDCLSGKIRCSISPVSTRVLSKIDAVYKAVILFIQWYNKQNNEKKTTS